MSQSHASRVRRGGASRNRYGFRIRYGGAAALTAVALLLAGCSSDGNSSGQPDADPSAKSTRAGADAPPLEPLPAKVPEDLRPYYDQKLSWRSCGLAEFECATLRVPLDYDKPADDLKDAAGTVGLAVTRTKPQGGGEPKGGSLQINPGGPGGSAIEYVQQSAALAYPPEVREHYSLVGMDPRGVGRSEPIECLSDKQMDAYTRVDQTPDDAKETDALTAAYDKFATGCEKRTGKLLGHVSTVEAARDMDVLRAVLGDKKLNYVGASYGTYLGATYAGLFPERSGRLVLDGAMDPSLSARRVNREQTAGFETAFKAFARDCVTMSDCPLGKDGVRQAGKNLSALFTKIDSKPLKTDDPSRSLTESLATTGVIRAMYDEGSWPALREALTAAKKGDGAQLLALSDDYYERGPDGSYSNIMFANPAVNCLDLPPAFADAAAARKAVPSFEKASPVFGRGFAWAALNCGEWPVDATGGPHRIAAKGADPIVVVGTTRDPATPYRWAQGLAGQLSPARLVTYKGDGHTAYLRGSDCVDSAVNAYLVQGKPPKNGTTCG
ncbi:alpha/beta hydrolase [Streptomyces sp. 891-h]|uniref:alpha/beta hydrolase n=1 Tax=Streptomyces sp. 891-h TaxID=2720714 RepID=UPI001FAA3500|nr:alpha/beta hydrolase [Streptomyces sp. 891-h]UNZ18027.1 alpha/beta hydrolase [Streptomyces sp. 891-h]